ncbi:MAG: bifunctional riboflavin kinase/FAD synthetase [Chitinophagia bacterium]|jgi:riboflavin kinase/FMN adenylyltransferase
MQVHFQLNALPAFTNAVITIGTFDGVHTGHQAILKTLLHQAKLVEGESIVLTFHPHPRRVLSNPDAPSLLTSLDERINQFQKHGVDHLVVVPFDPTFSDIKAEDYVKDFLVQYFQPRCIVIGYDHKFGKDRTGDFQLLTKLGEQYQYAVCEIPETMLDQSRISSTEIRQALLNGNIKTANELLSYPFRLTGIVVEGDRLGRTLGYPTANLAITDSDKLIPSSGVYAVAVHLEEKGNQRHFKGMMNIGYRPTVNGKERRIEVHIFDFDEEIYSKRLTVELLAYTRKEMKFSGLDALKEQLNTDKNNIMQLLKEFQ